MKTAMFVISVFTCIAFATGLSTEQFSESGITLNFSTSTPVFESVTIQGTEFTQVTIEGSDVLAEVGFPALPVYRTWIEIPIGAEVVSAVSNAVVKTIDYHGAAVIPAVKSTTKDNSPDAFTVSFDPDTYSNGTTYPSNWVRIIYAGGMRGRNLALVEVTPVRWNPGTNSFSLLSSADISLEFQGGDIAASYEQAARLGCTEYETILQNTVSNYGVFEGGVDAADPKFLIIGHKDYVSSGMDVFVQHKKSLGFDVTMVDLSVTGSSVSKIRKYIQNAIKNGTVYVLLVGDTNTVPSGRANQYSGVTDLYYACLDDGGWIPDVFLGRFSVRTLAETRTMAQRVVDYEKSGVQGWVQNALFIASEDNSSITEGTHNNCIKKYLKPLGYNCTKVYPRSGGTASQAVTSINNGISMLTFSGHGLDNCWDDMQFTSRNFKNLNNDGMYPGVLSHACDTGNFAVTTSWSEKWVRTAGKGGLWFWGSVPSTFWDEDDVLQDGEYDSFLKDEIRWSKGFLNQGLLAVYEEYSGAGDTQYYYEAYNLLGDPSVIMKTWSTTGIWDNSSYVADSPISVAVTNPVYNNASVTLNGVNGSATLDIIDISGRIVETPFNESLSGTAMFTWDTHSLNTGIYFMRLTQGNNVVTSRVSVIR